MRIKRTAVRVGVIAAVVVAGWLLTSLLPIADPVPPPLRGWRTVGSYFEHAPDWPGKPWVRNGRNVGWQELVTVAGPAHCDWSAAAFLTVGWPLGTQAETAARARQYIRDPAHRLPGTTLLGTWMLNPTLPRDAGDSGYSYGAVRLFTAASDAGSYVYLVAPADSERWPRSDPMTTCA
jgi:hypothetical protein